MPLTPRWLPLFALACGTSGCGGDPEVDLAALSAPGPHAVGHRILSVSYEPPLGGSRRLAVNVWYPAEAVEGERPIYVLRSSEVAVSDAPPMALGPRPVLAFSHGHQAYAAAMSDLMEHVASHGYLAVAPTHTGNTFLDGAARETDIYYLRALDVSASLDHLERLEDDPLAGRLGAQIAVAGHSFGGYTSFALGGARYPIDALLEACAAGTASPGFCSTLTPEKAAIFGGGLADPRLSAILSFDPGDFDLFGAAGTSAVELPVLHAVAEASGPDPYWSALDRGENLRMVLLGGDHNDFTDACGAGLNVRCSTLPPAEVHGPLRAVALAFLERHLGGERERYLPLLEGRLDVSPRYELRPAASR